MHLLILAATVLILGCSRNVKTEQNAVEVAQHDQYPVIRDTIQVDSLMFMITAVPQGEFVFYRGSDTMLMRDYWYGYDVRDVNYDGYPDLLYPGTASRYVQYEVYVYKEQLHRFALAMGDCEFILEDSIPECRCFYSYRPGGCADDNWESSLFAVRGDSIVEFALMKRETDCVNTSATHIYRRNLQALTLVDSIPEQEVNGRDNSKSEVIRRYWLKHWHDLVPGKPVIG